jgi:nucleotide-binding universal stress UspA family protein
LHVSAQAPFFLGAAMTAIGIGVLFFYRRSLRPVEEAISSQLTQPDEPVEGADLAEVRPGGLLVAVGGDSARATSALAVPLARARGGDVHVLHVVEADIVAGEDAIELETDQAARDLLEACIAELRESACRSLASWCIASAPTPTSPIGFWRERSSSARARS